MAQKYEIFQDVGWDEATQSPIYERLTTVKNEQAAFGFIHDLDNIGKYGDMVVRLKTNGQYKTYNERTGSWE